MRDCPFSDLGLGFGFSESEVWGDKSLGSGARGKENLGSDWGFWGVWGRSDFLFKI